MAEKLADYLFRKSTEYTKLRADKPRGQAQRETPDHQSPGNRGLDRPDFDQWTTGELRKAASNLQVSDVNKLDREQLVERLSDSQHRDDRQT